MPTGLLTNSVYVHCLLSACWFVDCVAVWAMNPLPESPSAEFPPPCKSGTTPPVKAPAALGKYGTNPGRCAGNWPTTVNIVDTVAIPADTAPGEYVLSWRWGTYAIQPQPQSHANQTEHQSSPRLRYRQGKARLHVVVDHTGV